MFSLPRCLRVSRGQGHVFVFAATFYLHRDNRERFVKLGVYFRQRRVSDALDAEM